MPYVWSKLINKTLPTVTEALQAIRLAEAKQNADPRPLMYLLGRLPVADAKLLGLQVSATDQITGYDWSVVPSDGNIGNAQVEQLAAQAAARAIECALPDFFEVILAAEWYGMSGVHQLWTRDFEGKKIPELKVVPATELMLVRGERDVPDEFHRIADTDMLTSSPITPVRDQYIIAQFNPMKATQPYYIGGINRTALWLVLLKHINWQDWGNFNERYGDPLLIGKYKHTTDDGEKSKAWEMLDSLGKNSRALLNEDITVEVVKAMVEGSVQSYERLVEKVDTALAVLYTSATLSTETQGNAGSRAAAQVHMSKEEQRMWARLKRIERAINQQYLSVDWRLNVSATQPMPYLFKFITDEAIDYESNARIASELVGAGYTLDPNEVSEKTGYTVTAPAIEP
jgi:hypothetical protein